MGALPPYAIIFSVWLAVSAWSGATAAQEVAIPREHHCWGSFQPGAWKLVRVVTQTLDDEGRVSSTSSTETRTTLLRADESGVTLHVEVCMEVAGKQFETQPQTVRQDYYGELTCQNMKVQREEDGQVMVEGTTIPCKVLQLECKEPNSQTQTRVYYSDSVVPHVLKRESVTTSADNDKSLGESSIEVVARNMPYNVLSEIKSAAYLKQVHKHPKGRNVTWVVMSTDVPGGVVSQSSKESDQVGRIIRRSTLELLDYGLTPQPERTGLFGRKRSTRYRKLVN